MFVSNITSSWGLEESNIVWSNNASDTGDAQAKLSKGVAPFDNKAAAMNLAWVGWGWDAKMADFDNSGQLDDRAVGRVRQGRPQPLGLAAGTGHEQRPDAAGAGHVAEGGARRRHLRLAADGLLGARRQQRPIRQPQRRPRPDAARRRPAASRSPTPTATAARTSPWPGSGARRRTTATTTPGDDDFLGLRLYRPRRSGGAGASAPRPTAPRCASPRRTASTQVAQLDGGSGHSGKRSFDVFFGLGANGAKPVSAELTWRDLDRQRAAPDARPRRGLARPHAHRPRPGGCRRHDRRHARSGRTSVDSSEPATEEAT